ncbi:DUF2306 domain-containing protein [Waterburya agarophytonicola K14]|uniref:DUF2306 domain-containing protein n=1 Tax=Waterburya agarophytonicola KI4 TaxID=2874699 RepID=A0A964BSE5_9CYAN|nr:DUF2306 domain-containing protein [Waterburya agarophytonicola]MCC0178834.1 DUF2306 domain-containing protein [Waterburya agarophytonicola KI4]
MLKNKNVRSSNIRSIKQIGWIVMTALALLLFLVASRYLTLNSEVYFEEQKAVYIAHRAGISIHIVGAMLAIAIGPFQFLPQSITKRYLKLHRWLGKIYMLGVLFGSLGGLYMAFLAYGGFIARLGFAILAIVWLFSGYMAYKHIRDRKIQLHRRWMVRNYALTFAGVTLRLWQVVFELIGVEFIQSYIIVAWLSWVLNLIVAEWMVSQSRAKGSLQI